MKNLHLTLVPFGIALLVAGCGGGGSSTTPSSSTAIPTGAVKITATNATTVASGANKSGTTMTSTAGSTAAPTTATGVVINSSSLNALKSALSGFASVRKLSIPATVAGAVTSAALTVCSSGSGTASFDDKDNSGTFTTGDTISVTYSNCVDTSDAGITKNGSAGFTYNSIGASMDFSVTYTGYSETSTAETLSMAGDMTIAALVNGANITYSMTGTSLETNSSVNGHFKMWGPGIAFEAAASGTPYSTVLSFDSNSNAYSYDIDMSIASTEMGGSVSIVTNPAFTGIDPNNPTAGVMTITGSGGSYVTMTANANGTDVTLTGNDGTAAIPATTVAWTAL